MKNGTHILMLRPSERERERERPAVLSRDEDFPSALPNHDRGGAPSRAVLPPCTGLADRVFFPEVRDVHRVSSVPRTVCDPSVHIITFQ